MEIYHLLILITSIFFYFYNRSLLLTIFETNHHEEEKPNLPKVRIGARVMDLIHGLHFDDILMDTPDDLRPSSIIAFYNSSDELCMKRFNEWDFDHIAETELPARERLFIARYDMYSAPLRSWYKFVPELDLKSRMNIRSCPELVFVSRTNDGFMDWCTREVRDDGVHVMGCDDFNDYLHNLDYWDERVTTMVDWVYGKIHEDGEPKLSRFFKSIAEQGTWIQKRDHTSTDNHMRNIYLSEAFPNFTKNGFKVVPIPEKLQSWFLNFYKRNENNRRTEHWDAESTQLSFTEIPTTFLDTDMERSMKEMLANEILKPILEEWSGIRPLELTSFYGLREYPNDSFLKNHVDRIDTHVLSVTIVVKKQDPELAKENPWPLEVIDFAGDHVRHEHPEGTMILYESSKLPHGRPYRNKGGVHVGAFCHFKPYHMHGLDSKKWDEITAHARENQAKHTEYVTYKSTPSVEPETIEYSDIEYAAHTSWNYIDEHNQPSVYKEKDGEVYEDNDDFSSFVVAFFNNGDTELELVWISPTDPSIQIKQGIIQPGEFLQINTFEGHTFHWFDSSGQNIKEHQVHQTNLEYYIY